MASNETVLQPKIDQLQKELGEIELKVTTEGYTLADAIREGSTVTGQKIGGFVSDDGELACALSAAYISAKARGIL